MYRKITKCKWWWGGIIIKVFYILTKLFLNFIWILWKSCNFWYYILLRVIESKTHIWGWWRSYQLLYAKNYFRLPPHVPKCIKTIELLKKLCGGERGAVVRVTLHTATTERQARVYWSDQCKLKLHRSVDLCRAETRRFYNQIFHVASEFAQQNSLMSCAWGSALLRSIIVN